MTTDAKVQIGNSADYLEGTSVTTPAGANLFREGVVVSDPDNAQARAKILNSAPSGGEYGLAVRHVGPIDGNQTGTWDYRAGTTGTPTIPAGAKILQISAAAPTASSATFTINGGNTITIPAGQAVTFEPKGNLVQPSLIFTGTASYIVEFVT